MGRAQGWSAMRLFAALVVLGCVSAMASLASEPEQGARAVRAQERAPGYAESTPAERSRSRSAYEHRSDPEALDVAAQQHGFVIDRPTWWDRSEAFDERVVEYLSEHTAVVRREGDDSTGLLESTLPLRARTREGRLEPVDLDLAADAVSLRPMNPLVDLEFGRRLGDGMRFLSADVVVRSAGRGSAQALERSGKAFWGNIATDVDYLVAPTWLGAETFFMLRSAASPERMRLDLELPGGARLEPRPGGGAAVVRGESDRLLVAPPVAWGADGRPLEVTLEVIGNSIEVVVPHREKDVEYPIAVDPAFTDLEVTANTGGEDFGWRYRATNPGMAAFDGGGYLAIQPQGGYTYARRDMGAWRYRTRGTAYITQVRYTVNHAVSDSEMVLGIAKATWEPEKTWVTGTGGNVHDGALWERGYWNDKPGSNNGIDPAFIQFSASNYNQQHCVDGLCATELSDPPSHYGNQGVFAGDFLTSGYRCCHSFYMTMTRGEVVLNDGEVPSLGAPSHGSSIAEWREGGNLTVSAAASDGTASTPGLGLKKLVVSAPRQGGGELQSVTELSCRGTATSRCPAVPNPNLSVTYAADAMPEGINAVSLRAHDIVTKQSPAQTWSIKIDRTPPDVTPSGSLWDARGQTLQLDRSYNLSVVASEGTAQAPRSGATRIDVFVDPVGPSGPVQTTTPVASAQHPNCGSSAQNCQVQTSFSLESNRYEPGEYEMRMVGRDQLDHVRTSTFRVTVPDAGSAEAPLGLEQWPAYHELETGAGSSAYVNLQSGNLAWHAVPVVNRGRGLSTVVNLTYNSLEGNAGQTPAQRDDLVDRDRNPKGFSIGMSGLSRINEPIDVSEASLGGPVILVDADGTRHRFAQVGSTFSAPPGVHLHLRKLQSATEDKTWAVTRPDGVTDYFDSRGYQTRVEDRDGNALTFNYQYVGADLIWRAGRCPKPTPLLGCEQRLVSVVDAAGRAVTLVYGTGLGGEANRVREIRDHASRVLRFDYDSSSRLVTLAEPLRSQSFTWVGTGTALNSQTDPRGRATTVGYTGNQVASLTDRSNNRSTIAYANGDATVTDALSHATTYDLDARGRPKRVTDAEGIATSVVWDGDNMPRRITEAADTPDAATEVMTYNQNGLLTSRTDGAGRRTELRYRDSAGFPVHPGETGGRFVSDLEQLTTPRGTATEAAGDFTTTFTLDAENRGRVIQITDAEGWRSTFTYDTTGQITQEQQEKTRNSFDTVRYPTYDPSGMPLERVDERGGRWLYCYDAVANLLSETDPRGASTTAVCGFRGNEPFTTSYSYDALDRLTLEKVPKDSRNGVFITRSFGYDLNSNPTAVNDGTGARWERTYTPMDDLEEERSPAARHAAEGDTLAPEVTRFEYDAALRVIKEMRPNGTQTTGVDGDYTNTYTYDRAGRRVVERRQSRGSETRDLMTSFAYDRRDNLVGLVDPRRNALGGDPAQNATDQTKRRFTYEYDLADNRVAQVEDPATENLRTEWRYDANANLAAEIDPRAFKSGGTVDAFMTEYRYDGRDLLREIEDPIGGRTTWNLERGDQRPASLTTPNGNATTAGGDFTTTYTYEPTGELRSWSLPEAENQYALGKGTFTYERDPVGNPTLITDARGNSFQNTFWDTGDLRTTERPSFFTYEPGGIAAEDESPARPDARADTPGDGMEVRERTWDELVGMASSEQEARTLPTTDAAGDFGNVEPAALPSILPRAGRRTETSSTITELEYDNEMRLSLVLDAARRGTTITHDATGRTTEIAQPFNRFQSNGEEVIERIVRKYEYDRNGNLRIFRDPEGHVTEREFDQFDRLAIERRPGTDTNPQEITRLAYDANGNVTAHDTPRGSAFTWAYEYDTVDRLKAETNPESERRTFEYDPVGNQTAERSPRGNRGQPEAACSSAGAEPECFTTRRQFDALNRLIWERDGLSQVTTFEYDANSNQTKVTAPGATTSTGDARDRVVERRFDGRDLLWAETQLGGQTRTTVTEYDAMANMRRAVTPRGVDETTRRPDHSDTVAVVPSDSNAAKHAAVREYDADGLVTRIHLPWGDRDTDDRRRYRMDFATDRLGRVESIDSAYDWTDPCQDPPRVNDPGCTTRTSYTHYESGWIKSVSDPIITDPDNTDPIYRHTMEYDYDLRGNQTSWETKHEDDNGRRGVRTYFPNGLVRRRTAQTLVPGDSGDVASTRTYTFDYNQNRSLTSLVDANLNRTTRIEVDGAERPTVVNETWSDSRDTTIRYDEDGNVIRRQTDGRLSPTAEDPERYLGGKTSSFDVDPLGRETRMVVNPAGTEGPRTTLSDYHPSGALKRREKPNGVVETFSYEPDGRIDRVLRTRNGAGTSVGNQDYTYDRNGNRTRDERGTHSFNARDQLVEWTRAAGRRHAGGRVTYKVSGSGAVLEQKDELDPATTADDVTTLYEQKGNRLFRATATGGGQTQRARYCYDSFGALIEIRKSSAGTPSCSGSAPSGTTTYQYDEFERMERATGAGQVDSQIYSYDALDRRDQRRIGSEIFDYAYVGLSEALTREEENTGDGVDTYDYHADLTRAGQDANPTGTSPSFRPYALDALGSVVGVEDATGAVPDCGTTPSGACDGRYDYTPYGEIENEANLTSAASGNPFRFQGHYLDDAVDTYDMRARAYRPDIGRFLTQDRFEQAAGDLALHSDPLTNNRYVFAGANPVNQTEWDGHEPISSFNPRGRQRLRDRQGRCFRDCGRARRNVQPPTRTGAGGRNTFAPWRRQGSTLRRDTRSFSIGPRGAVRYQDSCPGCAAKDGPNRAPDLGPLLALAELVVGDSPLEIAASFTPFGRLNQFSKLRRLIPGGPAAKAPRIPQVGEGIVYRRTSRMGGKPYIGQSKSAARYDARQLEHQRDNPFDAFDYEILGRSSPGSQLDRLEEFFIRQGGGPTTRRNPGGGLANRRHQMRDERYDAAGGGY